MPSIEYTLFRAKFVKPSQQSIFETESTPEQLLIAALHEKPSIESRAVFLGQAWAILTLAFHGGQVAI